MICIWHFLKGCQGTCVGPWDWKLLHLLRLMHRIIGMHDTANPYAVLWRVNGPRCSHRCMSLPMLFLLSYWRGYMYSMDYVAIAKDDRLIPIFKCSKVDAAKDITINIKGIITAVYCSIFKTSSVTLMYIENTPAKYQLQLRQSLVMTHTIDNDAGSLFYKIQGHLVLLYIINRICRMLWPKLWYPRANYRIITLFVTIDFTD